MIQSGPEPSQTAETAGVEACGRVGECHWCYHRRSGCARQGGENDRRTSVCGSHPCLAHFTVCVVCFPLSTCAVVLLGCSIGGLCSVHDPNAFGVYARSKSDCCGARYCIVAGRREVASTRIAKRFRSVLVRVWSKHDSLWSKHFSCNADRASSTNRYLQINFALLSLLQEAEVGREEWMLVPPKSLGVLGAIKTLQPTNRKFQT